MTDESTELTTVEPSTPPSQALTDLRRGAMSMPVELMQTALAEYTERRNTFQAWLQDQLTEGVHYGFPPGCSSRSNARDEQWRAKPSLYKAGADLICDLMGVRAVYSADMDRWQQLGSPQKTYVTRCQLHSRQTGEVVGEGSGAFRVGEKKMDENAALKMSEKRAKVNATLNAYGLSDLFTQDLESWIPQPHDNPEQAAGAPQVPGRGDRADQPTVPELTQLSGAWKDMRKAAGKTASPEEWGRFVENATEGELLASSANKSGAWTRAMYSVCAAEIRRLEAEAPGE